MPETDGAECNLIRSSFKYFVFYKPYNVLSQFTSEGGKSTLSDFGFPKDVYPVGRLDFDSEGLLILTDDKTLNDLLLNPRHGHNRTYFSQVENVPSEDALNKLSSGVEINISGKIYKTKPAIANLLQTVPDLPERTPPIRFRASIPTAWISLTLTEGKNRQVRKMTASVGCPTLRLVRYAIENLTINGFSSGEIRQIDEKELLIALNLGY